MEAKVDWEKGWAWAKYDPDKTNPEELVQAINENTAFEAKLPENAKNKERTTRTLIHSESNPCGAARAPRAEVRGLNPIQPMFVAPLKLARPRAEWHNSQARSDCAPLSSETNLKRTL